MRWRDLVTVKGTRQVGGKRARGQAGPSGTSGSPGRGVKVSRHGDRRTAHPPGHRGKLLPGPGLRSACPGAHRRSRGGSGTSPRQDRLPPRSPPGKTCAPPDTRPARSAEPKRTAGRAPSPAPPARGGSLGKDDLRAPYSLPPKCFTLLCQANRVLC